MAHFGRNQDNIVSTSARRTGLGITLWQKNDGTIQPIAFAGRNLNDAEKNYSIRELELLAVVWGLDKFRFHLYSKVVHLYTDHQAIEPSITRKREYRHYSARLNRWSDRLALFAISIKYTAGKNLVLTDYLSRHPTEEATTEETREEENVMKNLSGLFRLNHKYGQLLNTE